MIVKHTFSENFLGKTIKLNNGFIELEITLDVGPRIIRLGKIGGENIMYNDTQDLVNNDCSAVYGEGEKWHIYGGHRLWLSPEDSTTYYPDNHPVHYELIENGIVLIPKKWEVVDVQPSMKIEFLSKNEIKVSHKMVNYGEKRKLCLWALTVMKAGGEMVFDLSKEDTGYLANRNLVMWSYASFNDSRLKIEDDKIVVKSDLAVPEAFKLGAYKRDMVAKYTYGDTTFEKRITGDDKGIYPDYSCNFETYCTNIIHEIETLSTIEEIDKDYEKEHIEYWSIF